MCSQLRFSVRRRTQLLPPGLTAPTLPLGYLCDGGHLDSMGVACRVLEDFSHTRPQAPVDARTSSDPALARRPLPSWLSKHTSSYTHCRARLLRTHGGGRRALSESRFERMSARAATKTSSQGGRVWKVDKCGLPEGFLPGQATDSLQLDLLPTPHFGELAHRTGLTTRHGRAEDSGILQL
jgi:hypothetical protein